MTGTVDATFVAAYRRTRLTGDSPEGVEAHAQDGWTTTTIERVEALAAFAVEHRTGVGSIFADHVEPEDRRREAFAWLEEVGTRLLRTGCLPRTEILGWIEAAAAAPLFEQGVSAVRTLVTRREDGHPARVNQPTAMSAWRWQIPADLAPLAFAAGLTPTEARVRAAAGTLTADGLRTLAGLRGWRFPSPTDGVGT